MKFMTYPITVIMPIPNDLMRDRTDRLGYDRILYHLIRYILL